ncbi:hypothetical protein [Paenibacillus sp. JCM 10914]|uniref:hypothetical protein n=1 Tax=Paenibacillus sp. JCM 10914 TaxID=1236974 RepID=UPI0005618C47|nr:hypothetical protein [Paenibacillus sp. JCM 10914]
MKRKLADRLDWNRVLHRKFISKFVDEVDFKGHITLISIYQVKESLRRNIKINEDDYRLAKSVMTD